MALKNFRTHTLAVEFYKDCRKTVLPAYAKDQLVRAAMSIALNLAEGSGKATLKERIRFYTMALGSIREIQSLIELEELNRLRPSADHLGACIYKLVNQ